jgi:hypothetical protein
MSHKINPVRLVSELVKQQGLKLRLFFDSSKRVEHIKMYFAMPSFQDRSPGIYTGRHIDHEAQESQFGLRVRRCIFSNCTWDHNIIITRTLYSRLSYLPLKTEVMHRSVREAYFAWTSFASSSASWNWGFSLT